MHRAPCGHSATVADHCKQGLCGRHHAYKAHKARARVPHCRARGWALCEDTQDCMGHAATMTGGGATSGAVGGELWVFGYGSLVWRPELPHPPLETRVGRVLGYKRRFWQGSTDHRGVPGAPGRVVTLLEDCEGCTWGVAYRVAAEHVQDVLAYLDYREKGGYVMKTAQFEARDSGLGGLQVLLYIATEQNAEYLGPAPLEQIATQIYRSTGPSGSNKEYLYRLCQAMRDLGPEAHDDHLVELEALVRACDK